MPEIRRDPLSGRISLIAPERGQRPTDFSVSEEKVEPIRCPFCPGNEELTPPEVLRIPEEGPWRVRIVPNRYPALSPEAAPPAGGDEFFAAEAGLGHHEVIIETPEHRKSLERFSPEEVRLLFKAFRKRARDLLAQKHWAYLLFFKNRGRRAGASLSHSHSQLLALPFLPPLLERELHRAEEFYRRTRRCLLCELADREARGPRLIHLSPHFVAFQAFAPRQPLETWILPRFHSPNFFSLPPEMEIDLARVLLRVLQILEKTLPQLPYNLVFHLEPPSTPELPYFHWHLELIPSLTRVAGFEWGAESYIVPLRPEEAAAFLRDQNP